MKPAGCGLAFAFLLFATPAAAACVEKAITAPPVLARESAYNAIFVYRDGDCASLSFRRRTGEYLESLSNLADRRELPLRYTQLMTLGFAYARDFNAVLEIGVGAGTLLAYAAEHARTRQIDGVDLDPVVLALARDYFGLRKYEGPTFALTEKDGRLFLRATRKRYDVILLDAFRGGYIPDHLTTKEFYALARSRLRPGGVLVANLHFGTRLFESSIATLRQAFPRVDLYWANGNVVAIAGEAPPSPERLAAQAQARQKAFGFRYPLPALLEATFAYDAPPATPLLTDDFAPANQFEAIASANKRRP